MASSVRLVFNHFPAAADALHDIGKELVKAAAFNVQHRAQAKAPVDTGALKNSGYVVTTDSSGYADAIAAAASANAKAQMTEPEPPPDKDTQAKVVFGAAYAVPVEYGSIHGHAQPFLEPAVAEEAPEFEKAWRGLEAKL